MVMNEKRSAIAHMYDDDNNIYVKLHLDKCSMAIFTVLIFVTQEHGGSFHFFASSLVSLINVL